MHSELYALKSAPRQIRYGFLSDFSPEDTGGEDITAMRKMHINTVQFYDWSYRHDRLIAPTDVYEDAMGKRNSLSVVSEKIRLCHQYGMQAIAYAPVYAASRAYWERRPEQGLYNGSGEPIMFIGKFFIMNPAHDGWREHLLAQYRHAVETLDFDGIHMDTYGFPKTAWGAKGEIVCLDEHFNGLINQAAETLRSIKPEAGVIFNNVGGWPVERTRSAGQKAVYIEVWPPCDRYRHLATLIASARQGGKPVVLAAYPAPFRTDTPVRALESELLCSFVIAMHGATQLFFGEDGCAITQGYYADYTRLDFGQLHMLHRYHDFFVQYQALFFDPDLTDVSLTHQGWDNLEYVCHRQFSATGEPNRLWVHIAQNRQRKVIYLVNLERNDDLWNTGKNKPEAIDGIDFSVQVVSRSPSVFFASPDEDSPLPFPLSFSVEEGQRSLVLHTRVPRLLRCGVLWIEEESDG